MLDHMDVVMGTGEAQHRVIEDYYGSRQDSAGIRAANRLNAILLLPGWAHAKVIASGSPPGDKPEMRTAGFDRAIWIAELVSDR
jgi:hypothetical protein